MTQYAELYERVVGVRLFPGSLNVHCDAEYVLPAGTLLRLEPDEYGGRVGMNIVPCRIGGVRAFILRTDQNESGTGHHSRNVVELAAEVKLRSRLGLRDGDVVEITIDETL